MALKVYSWREFRKWGVDVQALIGEPLAATKRYWVDPKDLPTAFQDRLRKDGFDVTRHVTFEAVMEHEGFAIEVHQGVDHGFVPRRV